MTTFSRLAAALLVSAVVVLGPSERWSPAVSAVGALDATGESFDFGAVGQSMTGTAPIDQRVSAGQYIDYASVATLSGQTIDARATFVRGVNLQGSSGNTNYPDMLRRLDDDPGQPSGPAARMLDHSIARESSNFAQEVMAEIRVEFFQAGTTTPVVLSNLVANFYDIDNRQAVEVDAVDSYALSPGNTHLTVTTTSAGALRFAELNDVPTGTDSGSYTIGRAQVTFATASAVTYRLIMLATNTSTNASFDVDFSLGAAWTDSGGTVTPVVTTAPASLSPTVASVAGIVNCPLAVTPLSAVNFGGAVTTTVSGGSLPAGLAWNQNTGQLSGSVSAITSTTVTISATGADSGAAQAEVHISITDPPLGVTPATRTVNGGVNSGFNSTTVTPDTPCGAVTYAVTAGSLPAGITISATTGVIFGTPTAIGTQTFELTVTDTAGRSATASVTVAIQGAQSPAPNISAGPEPVVVPTPIAEEPPAGPPVPVRSDSGGLPRLAPGRGAVSLDGAATEVDVLVVDEEFLVLRGQDFELRLAGKCTGGCQVAVDDSGRETIHLQRDGAARVSGFGFLPGSLVHVWIFSDPVYLGALTVAEDGTYSGSFDLEGVSVGEHTLQANGLSFDSVPRSANLGIVVVDAVVEEAPVSLPEAGGVVRHAPTIGGAFLLVGALLAYGASRRRLDPA